MENPNSHGKARKSGCPVELCQTCQGNVWFRDLRESSQDSGFLAKACGEVACAFKFQHVPSVVDETGAVDP